MRRVTWKILLGLIALLGAARLDAHNAPGSAVLLDFRSDRIDLELRLPLSELKFGFRQKLEDDPGTVVARFRPQLADYVRQHVAARAPDGRAWTIAVHDMEMALHEQPIDLVVHATLIPPAGAPLRRFKLVYDAISHEVMNHIVMVSVRSDWKNPKLASEPDLIGVMRSFITELPVDLAGNAGNEAPKNAPLNLSANHAPWLVAALALLALVAVILPRAREHLDLSS